MKTFKLLFLISIFVGLLNGCSKDDGLLEQNDDLMLKKAQMGMVFKVMPSGGDDTQALQDAFDEATAAGAGSVVQLCEGEYHIGYLEVYDFCGSLKGAGKGKTIITAIGGLDIDALWANHLMPCLVKFVGGDVNLSHFTMRTPTGSLSTGGPGMGHIYSLLNFSSINAVYEPYNEDRSINVVIDNVCFKGHLLEGGPGYVNGYNCMMAVRTGFDFYDWPVPVPREKIDFKITNSEFDTFVYGIGLETTKNSKLIVGEKNKGNIFRNLDQLGGIWDFRDIEVMVEGNTFNIAPLGNGLDLDDYPYYPFMMVEAPTKASLFNVQFNTFNLNHSQYALWLRNVRRVINSEEIPLVFQVKSNDFHFTDNFDWGIIGRVTKGAVIRNNKFDGSGGLGIYLDNPHGVVYNEDGLILGNNFENFNFGTGSVYLSGATRNWTIVGGDLGESIIDDGENNRISGFSNQNGDVPFGQTISEKLKVIRDTRHDFKKE